MSGDGRAAFQWDTGEDGVQVSGIVERDSHGAPVITSLTVSCTIEQNMGQLVRRLRLGDILHSTLNETPPTPGLPTQPARSGRQPMSDDFLRSLAVAYLRETTHGKPPGALKRLATEFDRPEETVRTWLARARERGWLGPSRKGRRGAEPGPRLTA